MKSTAKRIAIGLPASLVVAFLLLFVDWRPSRAPEPRRTVAFRSEAPLQAGAARVPLAPPQPTVVAGYPLPKHVVSGAETPLAARALVLRSGGHAVALLSMEALLVPEDLAGRLRAQALALGLDDLVLTATHAHSSFGQYHPGLLAEIAAMGRQDRSVARWLEEQLVECLRRAAAESQPVRVRVGSVQVPGISRNRAIREGPVDPEVVAIAFETEGRPLATLFAFGSHPTLIARTAPKLDGDYPARTMAALERGGGVALFVQGALGDVRSTPPQVAGKEPPEVMAEQLSEAVRRASFGPWSDRPVMAWSSVTVAAPPAAVDFAVPPILRRPAANVVTWLMPSALRVSVLRLGEQLLLFTPAEPTVAAAERLEKSLGPLAPAGTRLAFVSLADGYGGYLELPERVARGEGEGKRTLLGERLLEHVRAGLEAALREP